MIFNMVVGGMLLAVEPVIFLVTLLLIGIASLFGDGTAFAVFFILMTLTWVMHVIMLTTLITTEKKFRRIVKEFK